MSEGKHFPFIPAWLDDLGLSAVDFRVFCHLCRRAGKDRKCHPAMPSILTQCRISENTGWKSIERLEGLGLIVREKHFRNSNSYIVATSRPDLVTANEGVIQIESPQKSGCQSPQSEGCQSPQKRGRKGYPMKEIHGRKSNRDSNSAPIGTAMVNAGEWETVQELAMSLHENDQRNPDGRFGAFPPEEIEAWARDWHLKFLATGGVHNGSEIRNLAAALEAYLTSCASRQSKRFKQVSRNTSEGEEWEP